MRRERIRFLSVARLFALLLILLYHLFPNFLRGAFLGVELFFALSGFLLAHAFASEMQENGRFSLLGFWKRRILRVYPELFFSVLLTLPFLLLVSSDFRVGLPRQLAAVFTFTSNIFEVQTGGSYEAALLPHAFVHTWFLSVEIQLCICFGLLCSLFRPRTRIKQREHVRLGRPRVLRVPTKAHARAQAVKWFGITAAVLAAASYAYLQCGYTNGAEPTPLYFSPFTHALPFFGGVALCTLSGGINPEQTRKHRILFLGIAVLCAGGLVLASALLPYARIATWRFGSLLASLLSCGLIAALWFLHKATPERISEPKALLAAAELSYPLYLTHWPLWVVFSALFILQAWLSALVTLLCSVSICLVTRYLFKRKEKIWRAASATICAICLVLCGLLCADIPPLVSITEGIRAAKIEEDILLLREAQDLLFRHTGPFATRMDGADVYALGAQPAMAMATPEPTAEPFDIANIELVIIGDSVALGARTALRESFPHLQLDAAVSRNWRAAKKLLEDLYEKGKLPAYIVIALGTNPTSEEEACAVEILEWLPAGSRMIVVTPFDGRPAKRTRTEETARMLRSLAKEYAYLSVADWESVALENASGLTSDGVHLKTEEVRNLYVQCLLSAVEEAFGKPGKP